MSEPLRGTALMDAVLAQIEAHPEEWDQYSWAKLTRCGTTFCFAGWAVRLGEPEAEFLWESAGSVVFAGELTDGRSVYSVAMDLLEVDEGQADALFGETQDPDELRGIVADIKNGG